MPRLPPLAAGALLACCSSAFCQSERVEYARDVAPILRRSCYECHGEQKQKKGLRLDSKAAAWAGGRSGPALVPGRSATSLLLMHVEGREDKKLMPPKTAKGGPLSAAEIELLRRWIDEGAQWPDEATSRPTKRHWAYEPIEAAQPPPLAEQNEVDRFVLARLEQEGVSPSAEAPRSTLIRRLTLDLNGVAATPEEVAAFTSDTSPGAYEKVVDRLLASPRYGERMTQLWLDLARYADTKGYEKDSGRQIWRYRDWVISAFSEDMPFDRFTILQLAGDLLPDANEDSRLPTAFHRNTMTNDEGGTDDEEFRVAAVVDRVNTTMQVWMGSTLGCAQCHDHKYDPFSQREYYQLYAFFDNTADADRDDEHPLLELPTAEQKAQRARYGAMIARLEALLGEKVPLLEGLDPKKAPEFEAVRNAIAHAKKQRAAVPVITVPVLEELAGNKRRTTHLLQKGSFRSPGAAVTADVPAVFPPLPEGAQRDRLTLAKWLVAETNPLTARVLVNRLWEMLFGTGLVETSEDFGSQGESPSHKELLDWLAREIVREGWSIKRMLKKLVMSRTYRQSSTMTSELLQKDPHNRLLARGPRFRLPAETLRDQALAISGLLSTKIGGPPVMPPQPDGLWNIPYNQLTWKTSDGEDRHRRAVYTFWRRTSPYPSMTTFDAPDRMVCTSRRVRTNTPLQALVLLNDPVYVEAAQAFARRIAEHEQGGTKQALEWAFLAATARAPAEKELARLAKLHADELARAKSAPDAAAKLANATGDPRAPELAAWTVVANVLLNLDEVLTKG